MDFDIFNTIVDECKTKKPKLFGLGHDKILNAEEIELPNQYKEFLMKYGGGYFGYTNIYSLDEDSDFYILKHNNVPFDKYVREVLEYLVDVGLKKKFEFKAV